MPLGAPQALHVVTEQGQLRVATLALPSDSVRETSALTASLRLADCCVRVIKTEAQVE